MRLRLLQILVIFLVVAVQQGQAQDQPKIDSLFQQLRTAQQDTNKVLLLHDLSREFFSNDLERAMKYTNRALFLSEKLDYKKGIALSYNNLGIIHYYKAIYSQALEYHDKSLMLMEELGNKKGMAGSYNNMGAVLTDQGNYPKALEVYFNSLRILEELGDKKGMAGTYNNIGNVHSYQGNYPEALSFYKKSLALNQELGDESGIANSFNNMGIIHFEEGEYDKALDYHFKSLNIRQERGDMRGVAGSYSNIGDVYKVEKEFAKALEYQQKALTIQEEIGDKKGMTYSLKGIGSIYSIQGKKVKAISNLERSVSIAREIGAKAELKDAFEELAIAYKQMGDYAKAFQYQERHSELKDSLFSEETNIKTANLQARYENEKKQKEIELLRRANEIQELELSQNRVLIYGILGGFFLILIFAFIVTKTNRERKVAFDLLSRQNDDIRKQKEEKEVLLKEIHHRVKNNLQVINSLIRIQSNYIEDSKALELFDECQTRIISMALIHEKMYESSDLAAVNIKEYITQLTNNLISTYRLKQSIDLDIRVTVKHLGINTLIPLGLLLNELISNSLKHGFPERNEGRIMVYLDKLDDMYQLIVGDDGIGISADKMVESSTLGMELIRTLTGQLEGKIEQIDQPGTAFKIVFEGLEKEQTEINELISETV